MKKYVIVSEEIYYKFKIGYLYSCFAKIKIADVWFSSRVSEDLVEIEVDL